ncbi:BglG family transcription antiterminator [Virgibacillus siamensis]|uniref:BglG family transcription antiterminator n=1 Tax=Virgibacillus siamensis TaxID=480071 RepID=A0ABN1FJM0_9BACI
MLSPRQRNIINHMLQDKGFITIKKLAGIFQVSERSIQYDLETIEYYAESLEAQVIRNKRLGVRLIASPALEQQFSDDNEDSSLHVHLSPEERREKILITLFETLKPVSSNQFATLLSVSRRTIVDDLKEVQSWLFEHGLDLEYLQNKGFRIKGSEKSFRESYVEVLTQHYQSGVFPSELQFLSSSEIALINRSIDRALDGKQHNIVQTARDGLVFHLAITIHRIRNNFQINMPEQELAKMRREPEFGVAKRIQQAVEEKFSLEFPESETGYITLHLLGAKPADLEPSEDIQEHNTLTDTLKTFIRHVSGYMGVDLNNDLQLLKGLTVHLKPAIYRLRFNMRNENPLKQEVQKSYPNIIAAVQSNVTLLENAFGVHFNEDELAYIAMHVGSAIERKFEKTRYELRVVLVCASGVGTSQLLKSKIENYYPELNVYDSFSVYDIENDYFAANKIDLVISTIPTPEFPVPVVKVSPFLTKEDRNKLNSILNSEREKAIEKGLSSGPALNELLLADSVKWNIEASNVEEALRQSVKPLIAKGIVTDEYETAIIEQFRVNGPYMVIDKGVALPHAKPSTGVREPGFSFIRLKHPVTFGHSVNDPVLFVICLATTDAHIHLNALRQLTIMLQDHDGMERLLNGDEHMLLEQVNQVSQL